MVTINGEAVSTAQLGQLRAAMRMKLSAGGRPLPEADDELDALVQADLNSQLAVAEAVAAPVAEYRFESAAITAAIERVESVMTRVIDAGVSVAAQRGELAVTQIYLDAAKTNLAKLSTSITKMVKDVLAAPSPLEVRIGLMAAVGQKQLYLAMYREALRFGGMEPPEDELREEVDGLFEELIESARAEGLGRFKKART